MPQKAEGNGPSESGFPPLPGLDGLLQGGEALPDPAAEPEIGEEEGRKADPQDRKGRERQQLLRDCGFRYFTTFTGGKPEFKKL